MRTRWIGISRARRSLAAALLTVGMGVILTGCGAIGGAPTEGDLEAAAGAAISAVSSATSGGSVELELAQQQVGTLENQLNGFKDELKTTREALATAQAQVNKSEEQLRSELMVQIEEEINRISLERARLQAVQYAQQHQDVYGDVATQQLVWEVGSALEQDEFYYVEILYKPFGVFEGTPGLEEFIMEKDGTIAFRQVISQPSANGAPSAQAEQKPAEEAEKKEG